MIEYIVNKEKRTIVALMNFENYEETFKYSWDIFDKLYDVISYFNHNSQNKHYSLIDRMCFPKTITAKAKCSPEDEWDEEYGKQLARQRLVDKIHNYRSNSYRIIAKMVNEIKEMVD